MSRKIIEDPEGFGEIHSELRHASKTQKCFIFALLMILVIGVIISLIAISTDL